MLTYRGVVSPLLRVVQLNLITQSTMKKVKKNRVGSEVQYGPRTVGEILHSYLENSNEPIAVALRDRLFKDIHPHTELGVDLKLITRKHGRMKVGEMLDGTLVRDGEDHYLFMEQMFKMTGWQTRRNAHLYEGQYVNVNMRPDGVIYPTFRYGQLYNENITFREFCYRAAHELVKVAGRIEE